MSQFNIYEGEGRTLAQRNTLLPPFEPITQMNAPMGYYAAPPLRDAVNVAIALGQPLLLTGEPGTGKTQLAWSVAYELGLDKPFIFNTKTTSTAKDLFYRYDSLAHFRDVQLKEKSEIQTAQYITFEALGQAIMLSATRRSVVLIDEVDKAPRDLPNDLLNEFENMEFEVKETGQKFTANKSNRPILILTSNSEKNLPDAFLRRCIYYHIPFPNKADLLEIVKRRLDLSPEFVSNMLTDAVEFFTRVRENKGLKKLPATSELLSWIHILEKNKIDLRSATPENLEKLAMSYSILAKNKDDYMKLRTF